MAHIPFPLKFKRQFAGSLDADMVFDTFDLMQAYLSSPRRYAGQLVTCREKEGFLFVLNQERDEWLQFEGDKFFVAFVNHAKEITINHNLNKRPAVTVLNQVDKDVEGGETIVEESMVLCDVIYVDANTTKLRFEEYHTGRVLFN